MVSILRFFRDKPRELGFRYQNPQVFGTGLFMLGQIGSTGRLICWVYIVGRLGARAA